MSVSGSLKQHSLENHWLKYNVYQGHDVFFISKPQHGAVEVWGQTFVIWQRITILSV